MEPDYNSRNRSEDARARSQAQDHSVVYTTGQHAIYDPVHDSYGVREPTSRLPAHERPLSQGYPQSANTYAAGGIGRSGPNASLPPLRTYIHEHSQGFGQEADQNFDNRSPVYSAQGLDRRFPPLNVGPIEHIASPVASMPPRFPGINRPGEGRPETPGNLPSLIIPPERQSEQPSSAEGRQSKRIVMACHQW